MKLGSDRAGGAVRVENIVGVGRVVWLVGFGVVAASCSLEGLDRFAFAPCGDGTGCEVLNVRDHVDAAACMRWQCAANRIDCTFGPRDGDGDGFVAHECGGDDCDDATAAASPRASESCDGLDNDCNGAIDDVSAPAEAPEIVIASVAAPTFVSLGDADDGFVAAWRGGDGTRWATITQIATESSSASFEGRTAARPASGSDTQPGCPSVVADPLSSPTPCDASGRCPSGLECHATLDGMRLCEPGIAHRTPSLPAECTSHHDCQGPDRCDGVYTCSPNDALANIDPNTGCRYTPATGSTPVCPDTATCDPARAACLRLAPLVPCGFESIPMAAVDADTYVTAAVTSLGGAGCRTVRPGRVDLDEPPADMLWGGASYSRSWAGVGVDVAAACTTSGAGEPTVAGMVAGRRAGRLLPSALIAYRASNDTVGAAPVDVIGVWAEQTNVGGVLRRFASTTDSGTPLRLADATTSARIGVASFTTDATASVDHAGFVVAYARDGGGVAVVTLPALPDPLPGTCDAGACLVSSPDGTWVTRLDTPPAPERSSPPLGTPRATSIEMGARDLGDVVVATGAVGDTVPVLLAWSTATEVVLARGHVDATTLAFTDDGRIHVPAAGAGRLAIARVEAGLAVAGQFAGGTIAETETGGFVVTWSSSTGTYAARVADHDGALVEPGAVKLSSSESVATLAFVDYDDATHEGPRVRVAAAQDDALVVFPSVCGAP